MVLAEVGEQRNAADHRRQETDHDPAHQLPVDLAIALAQRDQRINEGDKTDHSGRERDIGDTQHSHTRHRDQPHRKPGQGLDHGAERNDGKE